MTKDMIRTLFDNFDVRKNTPAGFLMLSRSAVSKLEDAGLVRSLTKSEEREFLGSSRYASAGSYRYKLTEAGITMMKTLKNVDRVARYCDELGVR